MKKFFISVVVILVAYTLGVCNYILFRFFKWIGMIEIDNPENLPRLRPRMLIIGNHPDLFDCMYEIFLLPAIFFPQIFWHPLKFSPWFTPDKRNFTDKWYWAWLKPRAISVQRSNGSNGIGRIKEAREMLGVLGGCRGVMIHFPEGGRTCTGKVFQTSISGRKKIRALKDSVGWLALRTQACIFPVWVENGETPMQPGKKLFSWPNFKRGKIVVKFGKVMEFSEKLKTKSPSELTGIIAKNMLELADRTNKG